MTLSTRDILQMQQNLLEWYDACGRTLPWRVRPEDRARGEAPDPYAVWLSEIMLQQTTVAHATPYWRKFLTLFPTVIDLANADRDQVLANWAGLGYYARARNLHKCAQMIRDNFGGHFPKTEAQLLKLPGIGAYTSATIAAICYNEATNIVDGNVERVISRIFKVDTPLPKGKTEIRQHAAILADPVRPGDYGQALMDLGATVCTPTSPHCGACVWSRYCQAKASHCQTDYPKKIKKTKLPQRSGAVYAFFCKDHVLLERRPETGLLGGMMGLPGSDWTDTKTVDAQTKNAPECFAPDRFAPNTFMTVESIPTAQWTKCDTKVRHVFTHFALTLDVYTTQSDHRPARNGIWADVQNLDDYALPTVMKKALKVALSHGLS